MNNRIDQLDSLRGLAALTVVFNHIPFVVFASPFLLVLLRWLGINYGTGPVILFFILSGFVLSIPFLERRVSYFPYFVKRFFRIYVPYVFAIAIAILLSQLFYNEKVEEVGSYSNMLWTTPISLNLIFEHIYFLGNIHSNAFNGVIWSLIHELRISLIFPFIVLMIKRLDWKMTIIICLVLSTISGFNNVLNLQLSNGMNITYFHTIQYTALFMLGSLLAKHRKGIITLYQKQRVYFKWILLFFSFFMYNFSELFVGYLYELTNFKVISYYFFVLVEYGIAIGSIGFMISAMGSLRVKNFLLIKPIAFLGKISYSLYLFHLPVILSCIYLLHEVLPFWVISFLGLVLSIIISTIAWVIVEKPSMVTGRKLSKRLEDKRKIYKSKSIKGTA
jgi:peptidoglycan/LPS O-acetylase OafA/YrhL